MKLSHLALLSGLLFPLFAQADGMPKTLVELAGYTPEAAHLKDAVLIIVDAQREYVDGHVPLTGMTASLNEAEHLLQRARLAGTPVVHVVHKGKGVLFDPSGAYVEIVPQLRPLPGESVVAKSKISAFTGTELNDILARTGRKKLIIVGYMTHNCVSTTARDALDKGYAVTIVGNATATRDLPDGHGGVIPAAQVQAANLAALADRTATVVADERDIAE